MNLLLGLLEVAEEFTARIQHQHVALVGEAAAIGLQATVEGIELAILAVSLGINGRRLGIAITSYFFRLTIGFGQKHALLAVGVGTNALGQLLTFGAVLARFA